MPSPSENRFGREQRFHRGPAGHPAGGRYESKRNGRNGFSNGLYWFDGGSRGIDGRREIGNAISRLRDVPHAAHGRDASEEWDDTAMKAILDVVSGPLMGRRVRLKMG